MNTNGPLLFVLLLVGMATEWTCEGKPITSCPDCSFSENPLVVFMLDGMRWDYIARLGDRMPGFSRFIKEGVQAKSLKSTFPSVSYAAWTTLSTGVHPEKHGILANNMMDLQEDPSGNELFILGNISTTLKKHWWQNAEPIWITATLQEKRAFLRKWDRCDVPFDGLLPEEGTGYVGENSTQQIDATLTIGYEKLCQGFDLVMLYGEQPDNIGHNFGPDSPQMEAMLLEIDAIFCKFLQKIDNSPELKAKLNIIVVSDHGMSAINPANGTIYLKIADYVNEKDIFKIVNQGPFMHIQPKKYKLKCVYEQLKQMPGVDVYKRKEIPEKYHYDHYRALDLVLITRPGYFVWGLQTDQQIPPNNPGPLPIENGEHGYIPEFPDMWGIFYARGPAFKENYCHPQLDMVDVYQLYGHCLKIESHHNDGTWENVEDMLTPYED